MASAVTASNFETEVLQSDVPVLVDFWAEWCGPCKAIAPSIDQIAEEYAGRAKVFKVNVDEEGDLASRFGIMSIPAVLVFKGGKVVDQYVGSAPKTTFSGMLDRHI
jgi:thioredoxin 1